MSHLLMTGPIEGVLATSDGTEYDVTPGTIMCETHEHALEIAEKIRQHWLIHKHPQVENFEDAGAFAEAPAEDLTAPIEEPVAEEPPAEAPVAETAAPAETPEA